MRKYWYRRFLLVLLVLSVLGYAGYEITKRQEQGRKKEVSADTVSSDTVIPGGMPVGIYLETEGVMVLGTEKITGADGKMTEPARHLVKAGDYIVDCNGKKIADKKRLLLTHHIALWDVIARCDIRGSQDASIKNAQPNDIAALAAKGEIRHILLNGQAAGRLYEKYVHLPQISHRILPSTSPANAAWTMEKLTEIWREALKNALN